ncbi:hypothetical protein TVAG_250550 [Trichomonas vaginalis G3]|uniref:Importin N-terminal domain-containing protein n=1 Tax=Trichomonas vaginalis (strain ATCC PRA-98 / G3) TaxID=412133 RepID=A2ESQ4_TRIV3|nr:armadillo (ARM) repeat-containing protein family [Trichomonas vaginalis G3]EAY04295.1 hypothetical protein TVAG_250550 [Trichomonas vaginalis G3]KAI5498256.1 armadillo (ARM) repeat-containing protein family [Trichomonas vaginalis G3]|eukprot:XP_001316518.1 hypothetical protein [Trichomonas vaginalis G3]
MAQELLELYKSTLQPESIQSATEKLLSLYEDPKIIFTQLQLLNITRNPIYREAITIGLKAVLKNHWITIHNDPESQQIRGILIEILARESIPKLRTMLIDAISIIIANDLENWPEFVDFRNSLSNSSSTDELSFYLQLVTASISYLPGSFIVNNAESIGFQILRGVSLNDESVVNSACQLFIEFTNTVNLGEDISLQIAEKLLAKIRQNNQLSILFATLSKFIETSEEFEDPSFIFIEILELMANDEIEKRYLLIDPLNSLIKRYTIQATLILQEIVNAVISLGNDYLNDDCYDDQTDSLYVARAIGKLAKNIGGNFVYELLEMFSLITFDTSTIFLVMCYSELLDNDALTMNKYYSSLYSMSLGLIQNSDHLSIEASLTLLSQLFDNCMEGFFSQPEVLFQYVFEAARSECENAAIKALTLASKMILYFTSIPLTIYDDIIPFLTSQIQMISTPTLQYKAVICLTTIILTCGELVKKFAEDIFELYSTALESGNENPMLQLHGLEGMSIFINYFPEMTQSAHENCLNLILEAITSQDTSVLVSGLTSLNYLIRSGISILPDLQTYLQPVLQALSYTVDTEMASQDLTESVNEIHQTSFKILKKILKHNVFDEESLNNVINISMTAFLTQPNFETQSIALSVLVLAAKNNAELKDKLCDKLLGFITGSSQQRLIAFNGLCSMVSNIDDFNPELITTSVDIAIQTLEDLIDVPQDDEDEDDDKMKEKIMKDSNLEIEIFNFLHQVAFKFPQHMPIEDLHEMLVTFEELVSQFDYVETLGIFVEIFDKRYNEFPVVLRTDIVKRILSQLEENDYLLPAHAISGIRTIIEKENNVKDEYWEQIAPVADYLFKEEFDGTYYFFTAVGSLISLLITVYKVKPQLIDENIWNDIFNNIPKYLPNSESDNILDGLCLVVEQRNYHSEEMIKDILFVFLYVLTSSERFKKKTLELKDETVPKICHSVHIICERDLQCDITNVFDNFEDFNVNAALIEKAMNLLNQYK